MLSRTFATIPSNVLEMELIKTGVLRGAQTTKLTTESPSRLEASLDFFVLNSLVRNRNLIPQALIILLARIATRESGIERRIEPLASLAADSLNYLFREEVELDREFARSEKHPFISTVASPRQSPKAAGLPPGSNHEGASYRSRAKKKKKRGERSRGQKGLRPRRPSKVSTHLRVLGELGIPGTIRRVFRLPGLQEVPAVLPAPGSEWHFCTGSLLCLDIIVLFYLATEPVTPAPSSPLFSMATIPPRLACDTSEGLRALGSSSSATSLSFLPRFQVQPPRKFGLGIALESGLRAILI
ncbi:hypothetical protein KM043_013495 [Ampulex compressa]|nr:hypothetical protein KM043_013495 [Ampulex compressa]